MNIIGMRSCIDLTIEIYPLAAGWTVFGRYSGNAREERVAQVQFDELAQSGIAELANVVAGAAGNSTSANVVGATVAGGGTRMAEFAQVQQRIGRRARRTTLRREQFQHDRSRPRRRDAWTGY